ncbi:lytic polysaccharide monooxygenase auxiliary activity family 9 protein [Longimycelium tulufanense]|nr:lytic polysaccharide monooxygenase [Longimycelium tulufanense]
MQSPKSRILTCREEGPENPKTAACKAAIRTGGTQAVYDWNEVNIPNAAGRHRQIIPDGKLCSAGRDKYKGFDLPRADWPATSMPTSGQFTFTYRATAPHRGGFELYVTRDGYDPTKPLRWSDLEPQPFLKVMDPPLRNGSYVMSGKLPAGKSGRHLIYAIWQRTDSPEAFYSCSDVVFGGKADPAVPKDQGQGGPAAAAPADHGNHGNHGDHGSTGKGDPYDQAAGSGHGKHAPAGDSRPQPMAAAQAPRAGQQPPPQAAPAPVEKPVAATGESGELANTGVSGIVPLTLGGLGLITLGGVAVHLYRRRTTG